MATRADGGHPVRGPKVLTGGVCWRCDGVLVEAGGVPRCVRLGCPGPRLTRADLGLYLRTRRPGAGGEGGGG